MRTKYIYIQLFIAIALLTGCKKFLTQEPYNNVSLNDIFKDLDGAKTTLAGLYSNLRSTEYYLKSMSIYPEIAVGNVKYSRAANQAFFNTYNFSNEAYYSNNDMANFYEQAYKNIYNANNILEYISSVADASDLQKNRFKAEAHAFKALVYFDLARVFAMPYNFSANASHPAVILKKVNTSPLTPKGEPATAKEIFDYIKLSLDSSLLYFQNSTPVLAGSNEKYYWSVDAVKALKSRVALYTEDWATTIANATDIIGSGKYTLLTTANYVNSWRGKTTSSESIFEIVFGNVTGGSLGDNYNPANTTFGMLATSNDLLNLFAGNDIRGKASMFISGTGSLSTFSFTRKYQGMQDSANNVKLLRVSEIYLNRAEAYAENGNLTEALADLNLIRKRASSTFPNLTITDKQQLLDSIYVERRRELCFEGHGIFDVSRKKKNLVRVDNTATIKNLTYPDPKFACPIPNFN